MAYWEADVYFDWLDKLANGTVSAEEVVERFRHYERVARHQELAGQPPCPACGLYDPRREVVAVRDGA